MAPTGTGKHRKEDWLIQMKADKTDHASTTAIGVETGSAASQLTDRHT